MDYWRKYPPNDVLRRVQMIQKSDWKPPREIQSSSLAEINKFASTIGITVGTKDDLPPHLRMCLDIANKSLRTGKVN